MDTLPLLNPGVGIERIDRALGPADALPAARDAEPVGTQPLDNLSKLYSKPSLSQAIQSLVAPRIEDPGMLMPGRFEGALLEAFDKITARADAGDPAFREAARHLGPMRAAREQCWANIVALAKV